MSDLREFNFHFDELEIDIQKIIELLGYKNEVLPEPFNNYLKIALKDAESLEDIRACYVTSENITVDSGKGIIKVEGISFQTGRTITNELKGSEKLAFFVCTAGNHLSEISRKLLKGDEPVLGYVYDLLGNAIADAAANLMQLHLRDEFKDLNITNRYSPGYCNWNIDDQHKLFSLFGVLPAGVCLSPSAVMIPLKSISGVIGLGKNVSFRDYQCSLCNSKNCIYRKLI